ncbi:MAG TPA: hypothetical protein VF463_06485 [Sphingobium sp.]
MDVRFVVIWRVVATRHSPQEVMVGGERRGRRRSPHTADRDLAAALARLKVTTEGERLRVFREYLARTVRIASPLLLEACRPDELDEAVWRLRPGTRWPSSPVSRIMVRGWSAKSAHYGPVTVEAVEAGTGERYAVMDKLALVVGDRSAHMILAVAGLGIRTNDRGGRLLMPRLLDFDERDQLVGAPLDMAVRHPILNDRQYIIAGVESSVQLLQTQVDFLAPPEEWRVPWARRPDMDPF